MTNPASHLRATMIGVALWVFAVAQTAAVEKTYETPIGVLTIDVDSSWSEMSEMPDALNGIGFEIDGGDTMQFMLGQHEDLPAGSANSGTLRMLTNDLRKIDAGEGLKVPEEVTSFSGRNFTGYFYLATNPASMPAAGDYKFMYTGFIAVGSTPLMFLIAWNQGGKTAADRALASLDRLKIR